MSIGSIQMNIKLKLWYVVLIKTISFIGNKKLFDYVFHKFWNKGVKLSFKQAPQ